MRNKDTSNQNIIPFVPHPYIEGEKYFIRTVTMYFTGLLKEIYPGELVFDNVTWICDTGRFSDAINSGIFNEQEKYGDGVIINRGSIIDIKAVGFDLPNFTK